MHKDASRIVDEALALDPKFAGGWALRGRVASAAGQHRQALADYQRALGYAPDDTEVAILVADCYRLLNEPQRALVALQSVADRYSRDEEPQNVMFLEGITLISLGRYDDASRVLSKATHRDRPTADILCRLAEAEMLAGRVANAQANIQGALAPRTQSRGQPGPIVRLAMAAAPGSAIAR